MWASCWPFVAVLSLALLASRGTAFVRFKSVLQRRLQSSRDDQFTCFDEAVIFVRGGSGGHGSTAHKFGKGRQHLSPTGGSGGDGGSVYVRAISSINTLRKFGHLKSFRADHGSDGDVDFAHGLKGKDVEILVPLGTVIYDNATNAVFGSIVDEDTRILVARGGKGGKGNSVNRAKGEKSICTPPEGGERRFLKFELKLIADIGLLGVPNAGKSTLLDALTNAKPKIADYAFTTLTPNLGVCDVPGEVNQAMVIADIPGLIEGAHNGTGLGRGFLRHVERCKILLHIVNGKSADPVQDYLAINKELVLYSKTLSMKPQIVVLNKIDDPDVAEKQEEILKQLRTVIPHARLLAISGKAMYGMEELVERTWRFLQKLKTTEEIASMPQP